LFLKRIFFCLEGHLKAYFVFKEDFSFAMNFVFKKDYIVGLTRRVGRVRSRTDTQHSTDATVLAARSGSVPGAFEVEPNFTAVQASHLPSAWQPSLSCPDVTVSDFSPSQSNLHGTLPCSTVTTAFFASY
jgi:hypothetical protein